MKILATLTAAALLVSACGTYEPVVDLKASENPGDYHRDLLECRNLAETTEPKDEAALWNGLGGMVVMAAIGAAGAYVGGGDVGVSPAEGATVGAAGGALGGATAGAIKADYAQDDLVRDCMTGRGYKVLK